MSWQPSGWQPPGWQPDGWQPGGAAGGPTTESAEEPYALINAQWTTAAVSVKGLVDPHPMTINGATSASVVVDGRILDQASVVGWP